MTISCDSITCERCAESFSMDSVWGNFLYELPGGTRLPLEREMAWCNSCGMPSEVENLDHSPALQEELGSVAQELASLPRGLASLMPASRKRSQELASKIETLQRHLTYLKNRTDPPRCLTCGSTDWTPMPSTGFKHPGCGGAFHHSHADFLVSRMSQTYLYNPDGTLLRELGDW